MNESEDSRERNNDKLNEIEFVSLLEKFSNIFGAIDMALKYLQNEKEKIYSYTSSWNWNCPACD